MFARLYWILPLVGTIVWLGTLLAMLGWWVATGSRHFASMAPRQHIAYISDVGAQELKPLFIAGSAVTVVCLDAALIAERWLRHIGRLAPNTSWVQKGLSIVSIVAGIVGAAGLILLSIFDTLRHPKLHDAFLVVFIAGYVVSAIFICAEYQRLGIHFRQHAVLRISFWIKLAFIIVEVALAIAFGVLNTAYNHLNTAAVLEWILAFIFTFYVLSFFMDLVPAVRVKHDDAHPAVMEVKAMENGHATSQGYIPDTNGHTNGTANSTNF